MSPEELSGLLGELISSPSKCGHCNATFTYDPAYNWFLAGICPTCIVNNYHPILYVEPNVNCSLSGLMGYTINSMFPNDTINSSDDEDEDEDDDLNPPIIPLNEWGIPPEDDSNMNT